MTEEDRYYPTQITKEILANAAAIAETPDDRAHDHLVQQLQRACERAGARATVVSKCKLGVQRMRDNPFTTSARGAKG